MCGAGTGLVVGVGGGWTSVYAYWVDHEKIAYYTLDVSLHRGHKRQKERGYIHVCINIWTIITQMIYIYVLLLRIYNIQVHQVT